MLNFFPWLALNMDSMQRNPVALWKLGPTHQGRECLGQDPAVPDDPITDCTVRIQL